MKTGEINFNTDNVIIYLAGAGTGKTTTAIKEIIKLLDSYLPSEISYTTFTRKGVREGRQTVVKQFGYLSSSDLINFSTIHSLCYRQSRLKQENLFTREHLLNFNRVSGFNLTGKNEFDARTKDDELINIYNSIRAGKEITSLINVNIVRFDLLKRLYDIYKKEHNLFDYQDCIDLYVSEGEPLPCKVGIVDEAQDLTPTQWKVVEKAFFDCEVIKCFGDDFQSIYTHSGASPEMFIELADKYDTEELSISYRIPFEVYRASKQVTNQLIAKTEKDFRPADENKKGFIEYNIDVSDVPLKIINDINSNKFHFGRFLWLFRTNIHINNAVKILREEGIPYHTNDGFCINIRKLNRIQRIIKLRGSDKETQESEASLNFKKQNGINNFDDPFISMGFLSLEEAEFITKLLSRFSIESLIGFKDSPCILISTIHKIKGGEADIVFLSTEATRRVYINLIENQDEELRVLYVALTRAREGIYCIKPSTRWNISNLLEITK